ncbi:AAA family ATPase [Actinoallomurus soli]|uniref:AAA family ATPase n=1 Tax=Actinoallomurus soli TaxID=2952535 RepID=UPI002091EAFA|nr:AAA family ATPase [Actinoallomurus soli]MCO5968880.1 AAA family ATPase [Actinoallomurus soli]
MAPSDALADGELAALIEGLVAIARAQADSDDTEDALDRLNVAHELARGGRVGGGPSRQMRLCLQAACDVMIRQQVREIGASEDGSVDALITELEELINKVHGQSITLQYRIRINEVILRELESLREANGGDVNFEQRLVRNNITAVLGLVLPHHMKSVQARWREIARHVAPHALRFAEEEYALPQPLTDLLGPESLERLEEAVSSGDNGSLIDALADVEDLLTQNLMLRLNVTQEVTPPERKVFSRPGVQDPQWLNAKAKLDRNDRGAILDLRNLWLRRGQNVYTRMWLAYAYAKLGRPGEIHEAISLYQGVIADERFDRERNGTAYWNLAVSLSRVPALTADALDALLPVLDLERHPAGALDLAMLWALQQGRTEIQQRLYAKFHYPEARLLGALASAREGVETGERTASSEHLRRLSALLSDPDHEFPNPAERIDVRKLDQAARDFVGLHLLDAGIEWFQQRLTYPGEFYSYKNWECLADLYEHAGDLPGSWRARCQSMERTLRTSAKQRRPEMASGPFKRLLTWGMRHGFQEEALRELRKNWQKTTLSPSEVRVWEEKLGPVGPVGPVGSRQAGHSEARPTGGSDRTRGPQPDGLSATAAQEIVDRLAPRFEHVSSAQGLSALAAETDDLLTAAAALGRSGPQPAIKAIRAISALASEFQRGVNETRAQALDAEMREHGQALAQALDGVPLELRGLARASLNVVQGLAAHLRGVPDLNLTMPPDLHMTLTDQDVRTRLAIRLHNPAVEAARRVRVAFSSETPELTVLNPLVTLDEIPPEERRLVDVEVQLTGAPAPAACKVLCHVTWDSLGVEREVHARADVPVGPPGDPVPVTERFVLAAPVAADRVDLFQGRDRELRELREAFAGGRMRRLYFVNGIRKVGKSTLVRHLGRVCAPEVLTLMVDFDIDTGLNDKRLIRELLRKAQLSLREYPEFADYEIPLPGAADFELDAPWTVFETSLRDLQRRTGRQILICFDELQEVVRRINDPAEELSGSMLSWLRTKVQSESDLLFLCTGSESYDATKRRVESRLWANMQPYNISFVDRSAMTRIVTVPLQRDDVRWLPESLDLLWDLTEGHPWVIQVLAAGAVTALNREQRRVVLPGDIIRAADVAATESRVSDWWWNEEEGVVTEAHRQIAFLILKHQPGPRRGVTTSELFQACARSGIQSPGMYVDTMAALELLTLEESADGDRWRIRGGFLERYLESLLARVISEAQVDTSAKAANQPLGVFLDVENIKRSLMELIEERPVHERARLERRIRGDELGNRLLKAAARHGNPMIRWAVANWHVAYLEGDQMSYKAAGYQPDIAGADKANASDHVLKEHIHAALRDNELSAFVIGTGDGDYQAITQTLQSQGKYLVLWATRRNMSNAFGANLRSSDGMLVVEFLEDIVFSADDLT